MAYTRRPGMARSTSDSATVMPNRSSRAIRAEFASHPSSRNSDATNHRCPERSQGVWGEIRPKVHSCLLRTAANWRVDLHVVLEIGHRGLAEYRPCPRLCVER